MIDWISVKDKLPKEGEEICAIGWLIGSDIREESLVNIGENFFVDEKFKCFAGWRSGCIPWDPQPTHWMKKPEPPEMNNDR